MSLWFVDMNHRVKNPGRSWSCPDSVASAMVVSCLDVLLRGSLTDSTLSRSTPVVEGGDMRGNVPGTESRTLRVRKIVSDQGAGERPATDIQRVERIMVVPAPLIGSNAIMAQMPSRVRQAMPISVIPSARRLEENGTHL